MTDFSFDAACEADTDRLGAVLAANLPDGTVVALHGTLGAGKTRLVQAVAEACGIGRQQVTSPTFVLCQTYRGNRTIHHFDVYRLKEQQEFLELGPEEYFESAAVSFVEWAEKVDVLLPPEYVEISIAVTGETRRRFTLRGRGSRMEPIVHRLAGKLHGPAAQEEKNHER